MRRVVFLLAPRWLALHVVVLAAAVTMVLLGRWQWHVAHVRHGAVQNYAYAFQWWAFTGFALLMWLRVMRDAIPRRIAAADQATDATTAEPAASENPGVAYRRYVMPQHQPENSDPELSAYNAYLADLARRNRGA
jgi:DNA-binding transcriptional regulator of glucitol operon